VGTTAVADHSNHVFITTSEVDPWAPPGGGSAHCRIRRREAGVSSLGAEGSSRALYRRQEDSHRPRWAKRRWFPGCL